MSCAGSSPAPSGDQGADGQSEAEPLPASDFLQALADGTPTPGGGSAAAYSGAAAAALIAMVARLTIGKKKYAGVQDQMQAVLEKAEGLREKFTNAIQRDAAAFTGVMEAFRLPKNTPEEETRRQGPIAQATLEAARVPLELPPLDLAGIGKLTFFPPDHDRCPCLQLGYDALKIGGTMPAVLNAANEIAVCFASVL